METTRFISVFFLTALCACQAANPPVSPRKFTDEQLKAQFPYDLGRNDVDVWAYPAEQQANYKLFAGKCSQCHTLARPLNSPYVEESDWTRYVHRMHGKAKDRFGEALLEGKEAGRVVSFLTFDARERKVKRAPEFMRSMQDLQAKFEEVKVERERVQREAGAQQAREPAPYVGDRR